MISLFTDYTDYFISCVNKASHIERAREREREREKEREPGNSTAFEEALRFYI